ncbi:MAG: hypothetical protein H6624_10475 [Bdellovibrionaceae bacterium]|nr:hypothetical protein [Bdellovibrionales bacterium]MCB9084760.1 hypothetical protein [Pseudobdellovibrionaceae bacterium]
MGKRSFGWIKGAVALSMVAGLASSLSSCESDETNAISKGQECLDKARTPAAAKGCRGIVDGLSSQQAMIVRCAIEVVSGGLTTSKVSQAFQELENATTDKEATMMGIMANDDGPSAADTAAAYCNASGIAGLQYLANLSVVGTYMVAAVGSWNGDGQALINQCSTPGNCNDAAIGTAIITIGQSYCGGQDADQEMCNEINQAIATGGGDPATVAQQLYPLLNN